MFYKVLHISAASGFYRVERYPIGEVVGPLDIGIELYDKTGGLTIGAGLLAGSILPGTNRLIVCGRSPAWGGFYVSTMGGAALIFDNLGLNAIHLTDHHPIPAVLLLNREHGEEIQVRLLPLPLEAIWRGYRDYHGFYALSHWVWDQFAGEYKETPRILATGPAALATDFGALGSLVPHADGLSPVDTWAGRGGFGTKLLRDHGIAAVIYGGSVVDEDFRDRKVADQWFENRYLKKMKIKDLEATTKYRYDPLVDTGGTFGVNYAKMGGRLLAFNYRSVLQGEAEREALQNQLIKDHYLRQFNEETIQGRQFKTCGEPCAAVCKKMMGEFKKDYEPYHAMGPQIGVFDQRAAEQVVHHSDAMGFDAISLGGILSWIGECLETSLLTPDELGLPGKFKFTAGNFDREADSRDNADLAIRLIDKIIARHPLLDLWDGARSLARRLAAERHEPRIADCLVVNAFGNRGWMVPNQYWTPGVFSPMAVMGKYYQHYGEDYLPPRKLGAANAERMIREMMVDNSGMCRFHRAWSEDLIPDIFRELYGESIDMLAHHRRLAQRLTARNQSNPWEGRRIVEIIAAFLRRKIEVEGQTDPELSAWHDRFLAEPKIAALDFWYEIHKGVRMALVD
ncbi:MAG: aldehyde ferredoxin oxidoreductase [Myxococcales bacterium]|nr:aldehyde ferredoxin oxidoreductase [Myxococcales bacterium]